jgi:hypothetical protein
MARWEMLMIKLEALRLKAEARVRDLTKASSTTSGKLIGIIY